MKVKIGQDRGLRAWVLHPGHRETNKIQPLHPVETEMAQSFLRGASWAPGKSMVTKQSWSRSAVPKKPPLPQQSFLGEEGIALAAVLILGKPTVRLSSFSFFLLF